MTNPVAHDLDQIGWAVRTRTGDRRGSWIAFDLHDGAIQSYRDAKIGSEPAYDVVATYSAAEIERLTRERDEALEWKKSIRGLCVALGADAHPWAGDKNGWGFNFEFIKWLHRRAETAEAQIERLTSALTEVRPVIASFDKWALGEAGEGDPDNPATVWSKRNELLQHIDAALQPDQKK